MARTGAMLDGDGARGHRIDSAPPVHRLVGRVGLSFVHRDDGCLGGVAPPKLAKEQKKRRTLFCIGFTNSFNTSFPNQHVVLFDCKVLEGRLLKTGAPCG